MDARQDRIYGATTCVLLASHIPFVRNAEACGIIDKGSIHLWQLYQVQAYHAIATMNILHHGIHYLSATIVLTGHRPEE